MERQTVRARLGELDYLKCALILLMVAFHLSYFSDLHPQAKQVVYAFHMPAFLVISGYLMNMQKAPRAFLHTLWWYAVPYLVMESAYVVMASLVSIREHIDSLTAAVFIDKLLVHPLGPYWYLHTLVVCGLCSYGVFRFVRLGVLSQFLLLGLLLYGFSALTDALSFSAASYFLAGLAVRRSGWGFLRVFRASWLAVPVFVLLAVRPDGLHSGDVRSWLIVYMAVSSLLCFYPFLRGRLQAGILFVGRHTLLVFLFSPVFTLLCKGLLPFLRFEPTGLLFVGIAVPLTVVGSLLVGLLLDALHLSPYLLGRQAVERKF